MQFIKTIGAGLLLISYEIPNSRFQIPDPKFQITDLEFQIPKGREHIEESAALNPELASLSPAIRRDFATPFAWFRAAQLRSTLSFQP